MINGIVATGAGGVDNVRRAGVEKPVAVGKVVARDPVEAAVPNPAAELASAGPPVDVDKVAQIRAAIANGSYKLDIQHIADRMIDIDILPRG